MIEKVWSMVMTNTVAQKVEQQIKLLLEQGKIASAVLVGHEDWLDFSTQSEVSYTPFGSARRYQPALGGLQLIRVDQMHYLKVVTQAEVNEYAQQVQFI